MNWVHIIANLNVMVDWSTTGLQRFYYHFLGFRKLLSLCKTGRERKVDQWNSDCHLDDSFLCWFFLSKIQSVTFEPLRDEVHFCPNHPYLFGHHHRGQASAGSCLGGLRVQQRRKVQRCHVQGQGVRQIVWRWKLRWWVYEQDLAKGKIMPALAYVKICFEFNSIILYLKKIYIGKSKFIIQNKSKITYWGFKIKKLKF